MLYLIFEHFINHLKRYVTCTENCNKQFYNKYAGPFSCDFTKFFLFNNYIIYFRFCYRNFMVKTLLLSTSEIPVQGCSFHFFQIKYSSIAENEGRKTSNIIIVDSYHESSTYRGYQKLRQAFKLIRARFHQCSTYSSCAHRSRKRKKILMT
jgi:hypothetical protein